MRKNLLSFLCFGVVLQITNAAYGDQWEQFGEKGAMDIAAGGGEVYIIESEDFDPTQLGGQVHKYIGSSTIETRGVATAITVCSDGLPWVVNGWGEILYSDGGLQFESWTKVRGPKAQDIGCGDPGEVFITGEPNHPIYGGKIYRYMGNEEWEPIHGLANRIDVDKDGNPWVINGLGEVFRGDGWGGWQKKNRYWDSQVEDVVYGYTAFDIGLDNKWPPNWTMPVTLNCTGNPWQLLENTYWDQVFENEWWHFMAVDKSAGYIYAVDAYTNVVYRSTSMVF